ncbi:hypothetical protein N752_14140 [Desulforamulus aquiferis]|nr:hypothetical protein N752_14140 [Desulforamulus aquiferis]
MAIIVDKDSVVLVQGITGKQGSFHTSQMLAYGTRVAAGVSPGKGGQRIQGVPVFNTVAEAKEHYPISASIIFIPSSGVKDAAFEAMAAGIKTIVIITEHVPLHDALDIMAFAEKYSVTVIGPNTFGVISPGQSKMGIMPNIIYTPGIVGVVSRSAH